MNSWKAAWTWVTNIGKIDIVLCFLAIHFIKYSTFNRWMWIISIFSSVVKKIKKWLQVLCWGEVKTVLLIGLCISVKEPDLVNRLMSVCMCGPKGDSTVHWSKRRHKQKDYIAWKIVTKCNHIWRAAKNVSLGQSGKLLHHDDNDDTWDPALEVT